MIRVVGVGRITKRPSVAFTSPSCRKIKELLGKRGVMAEGYPIMLNLAGRICAVIGGGIVATRKVIHLLEAQARVVVISSQVTPTLEKLSAEERILLLRQDYQPDLLVDSQPVLVFAATDSAHVNQQVAQDAQKIRAWVNIADENAASDFSNMAATHRPPLTIAWHTGGTSPALSRHLKTIINDAIGEEYVMLARWLGDLRPQITNQVASQKQRQNLYNAMFNSDILPLLRQGREQDAFQQVQQLVRDWS